MRILVTGASGFIGGRIAKALIEKGYLQVVVGGRNANQLAELKSLGAILKLGDLSDSSYCEQLTEGADIVIHCAAAAGTWGSYDYFYQGNVITTQKILEAAKKFGVKRFINLSSPSVYSGHRDIVQVKEDEVKESFSDFYGQTKWEAEKLVTMAHSSRFATVSLRPRLVFGAGDQNVIPRLIRMHQEGKLIQLGNLNPNGDVTTILNLIEVVELLLTAPLECFGTSYNIANPSPIAVWSFIDMILKELGLPTKRKRAPFGLVMSLAKINEWVNRKLNTQKEPGLLPMKLGILAFEKTLDTSKIKEKLGYQPKYTTEHGVKEFCDWWKKRNT